MKKNFLRDEPSLYLQLHSENPVEWYPWNSIALTKAREENKPILLSIGYSACHWCHVMAHESFEDVETAELMNKLFVNIKVDKEERPDLDKIYQTTHYLLTQRSGGWPLTTFLTPTDLTPFFSGTYFPLHRQQQMPSFKDILQKIAEIYRERQEDIKIQNKSLQDYLHRKPTLPPAPNWETDLYDNAITAIKEIYDEKNGGFGFAPKFPQATVLELLQKNNNKMLLNTLFHMAEGGIYDQLGGGFFRYSVDAKWEIPHFEKMLYDNALLLPLYAQASVNFNEPFFAEIARETGHWVLNEMASKNGGYFSSLNADTEGKEGKFYIWDMNEIEKLLGREELQIIKIYYGLEGEPNFEGHWHLRIVEALQNDHEKEVLRNAKAKLNSARAKRIKPHRDNKNVTSWNALMIKGLMISGDILKERNFITSAQKSLDFLLKTCWVNKRLFSNVSEGKARIPAYLDDYAYLIDTLIIAYEKLNNPVYLELATEIADVMLNHFFDEEFGGFFFTSDDHEKLLYRPKTFMDESIPSGNGIAAQALLKLGKVTKIDSYTQAAKKTLTAAWTVMEQYPVEHSSLILAKSLS